MKQTLVAVVVVGISVVVAVAAIVVGVVVVAVIAAAVVGSTFGLKRKI